MILGHETKSAATAAAAAAAAITITTTTTTTNNNNNNNNRLIVSLIEPTFAVVSNALYHVSTSIRNAFRVLVL